MTHARRRSSLAARAGVLLLMTGLPWSAAQAATLTIINDDRPGEGFNDSTPVAPVPGNPGMTLGQQRLNVFKAAADAWGAILDSAVAIPIIARFDPLDCNATSGILGAAGPMRFIFGGGLGDVYHPFALANAREGIDIGPFLGLPPASPNVGALFNSRVDDDPGCLTGVTWWYGIGAPTPSGTLPLFTTVLHEIAHGLAFTTLVDPDTGAKLRGRDDVFMVYLEDHSTGKQWPAMNNAERVASAVDTGDLHWVGASVVSRSGLFSAGVHPSGHIRMYAPNPLEPGSSVIHWDTALTPNELMEPVITPDPADLITTNLMEDIGWPLLDGGGNGGGGECPNGTFTVSSNGTVCAERAYFCGLQLAQSAEAGPPAGCYNAGAGADVAERIDASEPMEPGDLVEIDPQRPGHYRKSRGRYSTLVGGIVASAPGITLANRPMLSTGAPLDPRPLLALMGRVPVKATAENGPIRPGDLLVSSSTPGAVMRCGDPGACVGAIVGKALEALPDGSGMVEVLLMS